MRNILVIEDERSIADTIVHSIAREGYAAVWCANGLDGLERVKSEEYALVVLDVGLPDNSGLTVLDLDWKVVNKELERERQKRRSGPIAENLLRDVNNVAAHGV